MTEQFATLVGFVQFNLSGNLPKKIEMTLREDNSDIYDIKMHTIAKYDDGVRPIIISSQGYLPSDFELVMQYDKPEDKPKTEMWNIEVKE